jgi:hypothetical protein
MSDKIVFDSKEISKSYTYSLLQQCSSIEEQLIDQGIDDNFMRLISIEATYNSFKQLVSQLTDQESVQQIYKMVEFDSRNLVSVVKPNVNDVGHS